MPAAAVIPALRVCSHIVAVKTPVVGVPSNGGYVGSLTFTVNKSGRLAYGFMNDLAQYDIFTNLVRSMRATGGRSISWRAVECSDP